MEGPNHRAKSESSGTSKWSRIPTLSECLSKLDEESGYNQVLRPEQYCANGRKAQKALKDAIEGEKVDKEYPPYTERYKIMNEDEMVPNDGLAGNGIEMILEK